MTFNNCYQIIYLAAQQHKHLPGASNNQTSTIAASPASFSLSVAALDTANCQSSLHTISEDSKEGGGANNANNQSGIVISSSQNSTNTTIGGGGGAGGSSNAGPYSASGSAREARSLQRRLMASNDIHEVIKYMMGIAM